MREYRLKLLLITFLLLVLGLGMVYGASSAVSFQKFHTNAYFFKKQFIFAIIGVFIMFFTSMVNYNIYRDIAYPLVFIGAVLLILTYVPHIGRTINGAHRWIGLGAINIQPSEIVKVFLIILMAYLLDKKQDKLDNFSFGFLPFLIIPGFVILMIFGQKDVGTCALMGAIIFLMMFIGGVRITYILMAILFFGVILYLIAINTDYIMTRFMVFKNPWKYYYGKGYQVAQSLISFVAGGFWGKGIGCSQQKLFYLPESFTDYIFSILAEEMGFLGVFIVVGLFMYLFFIGMKISMSVPDRFGRLLGMGLTMLIITEAFFNFAVCLSIVPSKGIALPFFSYGGSSLISTLFAIGILLNITREAEHG